jgi:hypothetical protein
MAQTGRTNPRRDGTEVLGQAESGVGLNEQLANWTLARASCNKRSLEALAARHLR